MQVCACKSKVNVILFYLRLTTVTQYVCTVHFRFFVAVAYGWSNRMNKNFHVQKNIDTQVHTLYGMKNGSDAI